MTTDQETEELLRRIRLSTSAEEDERILADALAAMEHPAVSPLRRLARSLGRHWRLSAAAAACVIAALVVLPFALPRTPNKGPGRAGQVAAQSDPSPGPAGAISSQAAGPEWVTTQKGQMEALLGPPGPGEVQLKRNLDGKRMNRRVPPDGWIEIGSGLWWNCGHLFGEPEGSGWHPEVGRHKYLEFVQEDVRVYVILNDGPRELAGIRFGGAGDMPSLRAAMKELSTPTILWCEAPLPKEFSSLPNLNRIVDLQRAPVAPLGRWDLDKITYLKRAKRVKFVDLSPLARLTGLTSLDLEGCDQVCDLSPLAKLRDLEVLNLAGCDQVTDLSPLADLARLESLDLAAWGLGSKLSDVSPLAKLTNLRWLNLRLRGGVHDVSPLAQLGALEWLNLDGCRIDDSAPLGELTKLKFLSLRSSLKNILDWSPLAKLTNLESLVIDCSHRGLDDISPLAELTKLEHLELSQLFGVSDLTPLAKLTNLSRLRMVRLTKVSDLSPLAELTNLESFAMGNCDRVSDLSPLEKLSKLKSVKLTGCDGVSDVSPLRSVVLQGADVRVDERLRGQLNAVAKSEPAAGRGSKAGLPGALAAEQTVAKSPLIYKLRLTRVLEDLQGKVFHHNDTADREILLEAEVLRVFKGDPKTAGQRVVLVWDTRAGGVPRFESCLHAENVLPTHATGSKAFYLMALTPAQPATDAQGRPRLKSIFPPGMRGTRVSKADVDPKKQAPTKNPLERLKLELLSALDDPDADTRHSAIKGLRRWGGHLFSGGPLWKDQRAAARILAASRDPDWRVRWVVAWMIPKEAAEEGEKALVRLLSDTHRDVRQVAASELRRRGREDLLKPLLDDWLREKVPLVDAPPTRTTIPPSPGVRGSGAASRSRPTRAAWLRDKVRQSSAIVRGDMVELTDSHLVCKVTRVIYGRIPGDVLHVRGSGVRADPDSARRSLRRTLGRRATEDEVKAYLLKRRHFEVGGRDVVLFLNQCRSADNAVVCQCLAKWSGINPDFREDPQEYLDKREKEIIEVIKAGTYLTPKTTPESMAPYVKASERVVRGKLRKIGTTTAEWQVTSVLHLAPPSGKRSADGALQEEPAKPQDEATPATITVGLDTWQLRAEAIVNYRAARSRKQPAAEEEIRKEFARLVGTELTVGQEAILFIKAGEATGEKEVHKLLGIVHGDPDDPKRLDQIEKEFPDLINRRGAVRR